MGKSMVSSAHTNATRIGWHLWEIDLRFAPGLPPGWRQQHRLLLESSEVRGAIPSSRLCPTNPASAAELVKSSAATAQRPRPLPRREWENLADPGLCSWVRRAALVLPCRAAGSRAVQRREEGLRQAERQPGGSHFPDAPR